jgi:hypothetical protein
MKFFRIILIVAAALAFLASFMPRESAGLGDILYIFLWPLLILQIILARLPWTRYAQNNTRTAYIMATIVGIGAFFVDILVLQLAGYVRPAM